MKTFCSVVALCLVLSCATLSEAGRLERILLQASPPTATASGSAYCEVVNGQCKAIASVSTQAIDDAATSIAVSLASAVASATGGGNVQASADTFAIAIAQAYARIISSHYLSVYVSGAGTACAFTQASGSATATAISTAVSRAFSQSTNAKANAAAHCFAAAVSAASVTASQTAFNGLCTNYGYDFIYERIITTGFVQTVAIAFSHVFTSIQSNNPTASALCGAIGSSTSGVSTVVING